MSIRPSQPGRHYPECLSRAIHIYYYLAVTAYISAVPYRNALNNTRKIHSPGGLLDPSVKFINVLLSPPKHRFMEWIGNFAFQEIRIINYCT